MKTEDRRIIITGDDFGSSQSVNRAIIEAHERGVLTSASLMVSGDAFEEAVELARQHPHLAVGLHLVLVEGRSVLPKNRIPNLVDRQGQFLSNPVRAGWRCQWHPEQVCREIRAQLEKFQKTLLKLSHVDGHQHLHLPPAVLTTLKILAGEFGIRAVRLPSEELGITLGIDRSRLFEKVKFSLMFKTLDLCYARRIFLSAKFQFADRVYGLLQSGGMTEEYLLNLIPQIRAHRVEIYSHPTTDSKTFSPRGASLSQLEALKSNRVREALISSGFRLSTYPELN